MTDDTTIRKAQAQMNKAALALAAMADDVAKAKQVLEYDSDRRKQTLSHYTSHFLLGESAAAAEHMARASVDYSSSLNELADQNQGARLTIERYEAQKILWESARSLLSVEKVKIGIL